MKIGLFNVIKRQFARNVTRKSIDTVKVNNPDLMKSQETTFDEFSLRNKLLHKINIEEKQELVVKSESTNKTPPDLNNYLVKQPKKNFRWGDSDVTSGTNTESFFIKGKTPEFDEVVKYLESWKMQDIKVFPTLDLGFTHLKKHSILATGYNNKHMYRCGKEMVKELKALGIDYLSRPPILQGRKYDDMMRIEFLEIEVFFFTEGGRIDADLEYKWTNKSDVDKVKYSDKVMKENKARYRRYKY